jgi:predicted ArsR family transcriptional regulator
VAEVLQITSMGARRQLEAAEQAGLVYYDDRNAGVGRPNRWWALSDAGHARFPDRHGDVMVQLLEQMRTQLGEAGMEQLIGAREAGMQKQYAAELDSKGTLEEKLNALVGIRTREGYMAELRRAENGWDLVEHHCPICVAATQCQAFCRSELNLFRDLLPEVELQRTEHLLKQGERCVYRIIPLQQNARR